MSAELSGPPLDNLLGQLTQALQNVVGNGVGVPQYQVRGPFGLCQRLPTIRHITVQIIYAISYESIRNLRRAYDRPLNFIANILSEHSFFFKPGATVLGNTKRVSNAGKYKPDTRGKTADEAPGYQSGWSWQLSGGYFEPC